MGHSIVFIVLALLVALQAGIGHGGSLNQQKGTFATTFESFFPIVDRVYRYQALKNPNFEENISLSMYRYYMSLHLYARLIQIRASHRCSTVSENTFAKHLHSIAPRLRCAEFLYLNGIGDIKLLNSSYYFKYTSLIWPNEQGDFGRVGPNSHWKYMSFPAPSVVAQAIREDFRISQASKFEPTWDLSEDLRPMDPHAGKPTANLLGWKPAEPMTLKQRKHVIACGINDIDFDQIDSQFFFNPKLVKIIQDYADMEAEGQNVHVNNFSDEEKLIGMGIPDQLGWLERSQLSDVSLSRSFASVERNVIGMWHSLQESEALMPGMSQQNTLLLGYRVKKGKGRFNDWAVYDWEGYKAVPDEWVATRNTVFEFGTINDGSVKIIKFSDERDSRRYKFLTDTSC